MFSNEESVECRVSANILLAAAHRLFAYDKIPLAMTLVQTVLDQYPDHAGALRLRDLFVSEEAAAASNRVWHLYYDAEEGVFYLGEKGTPGSRAFQTVEEAEKYLRGLK